MPIVPLPQKITQLKHEVETLKQSISFLKTPITAPPTAAAGSLLETMALTLTGIGDVEQQERSRLTKLAAMQNLLTDAESTLLELERQQSRSKPLYDSGLLRLDKSRKKFNKSIDAVLENWNELQEALKSISDDALIQVGTAPSTRTQYPMDHDWLTKLGKIAPMDKQGFLAIIRAYEYARTHPDGE